jgi:hypothetical protein
MTETKARITAVFREEDDRCEPSIPRADHSLPSRFAQRHASKRSRGSAHPVTKREHFRKFKASEMENGWYNEAIRLRPMRTHVAKAF